MQQSMHLKKYQLYVAAAALLTNTAAVAQSQEAIAECSKIASTGDRILCLEEALRSLDSDAPPVTEAPAVVDAAPVVGDDIATAAAAAGVAATGESEETEPAVAAEPRPAETGDADIGAEQLEARARRNMSREEALASLESAHNLAVAEYRTVPYDRLVVELENGQVWRQIKGDVQKIRVNLSKNQTVDIMESSLGGYQLRLNEMRRIIRAERIK